MLVHWWTPRCFGIRCRAASAHTTARVGDGWGSCLVQHAHTHTQRYLNECWSHHEFTAICVLIHFCLYEFDAVRHLDFWVVVTLSWKWMSRLLPHLEVRLFCWPPRKVTHQQSREIYQHAAPNAQRKKSSIKTFLFLMVVWNTCLPSYFWTGLWKSPISFVSHSAIQLKWSHWKFQKMTFNSVFVDPFHAPNWYSLTGIELVYYALLCQKKRKKKFPSSKVH